MRAKRGNPLNLATHIDNSKADCSLTRTLSHREREHNKIMNKSPYVVSLSNHEQTSKTSVANATRPEKQPKKNGSLYGCRPKQTVLVYQTLRLAIPIKPIRPEPNNQTAAGTGTGWLTTSPEKIWSLVNISPIFAVVEKLILSPPR